jgi:CheY-like chemotaxis protein
MPRLLLVDDNPSIHRIAESLLAPTDVELICVDSAAEALDRIGRGERFDVALVDTAMPGMDGWTLLGRLRGMEETARMPIALMAGVLDPVDPSKLAKAPIQGFLKKPIELRELGDRVKALLNTPVVVSPSPFSTVPATPARDLVKRADAVLPELRSEPAVEPVGVLPADLVAPPEPEPDLLLLTAEDLWPEEPAPVVAEAVTPPAVHTSVHLELEELDLDSLQDLGDEPLLPETAVAPVHAEPVFAFDHEDLLPEEDHLVTLSGLEELETLPMDFQMSHPHAGSVDAAAPAEHDTPFSHLPVAASLIGAAGLAAVVGLAAHEHAHEQPEPVHESLEPVHEIHEPVVPAVHEPIPLLVMEAKASAPAASGQAPAVPGQPASDALGSTVVSSEQARAVVQALLADPVLVDALVKAVVARMGDQVIREIAWEVMPDLAGRLQR